MNAIATIVGMLLVGWGLLEVFFGVLYPRAVSGPVAEALGWATQRVSAFFWRSRVGLFHRLIAAVGPALIVTQIIVWAGMLWLGFSLIVWPQLGQTIEASGGQPTPSDFAAALYFAGYALTTLGTGDLIPTSAAMRLLMVLQAAVGFSYFTLVLTYMMSVYSALVQRNHLALSIECRTQCTGDPYVYLRSLLRSPPQVVRRDDDDLAQELLLLLESHHFYPILHYFRFPEPHYSMPRILYFCLEVATVGRVLGAAPEAEATKPLDGSGRLWYASRQVLSATMQHFVRRQSHARPGVDRRQHEFLDYQRDYQAIHGALSPTAGDLAERYRELRGEWLGTLEAVARAQGIDDLLASQSGRASKA